MSRAYIARAKRSDWETPQDLFDSLDKIYHFNLDVCATAENAKCKRYFTPEDDGLAQDWGKSICWMNPPYGSEIGKWMAKAVEAAEYGAWVVCLVPARTDTKWWHDCAVLGEVRFIKGRLKFGGKGSAPFPSAIVILSWDTIGRANRRPRYDDGIRRLDAYLWDRHTTVSALKGASDE